MNLLKSIPRCLFRSGILAFAGLGLLGTIGQAATIDFSVMVHGRWVLIVPGSNTGGRVIYSTAHGCPITDRAVRGETVRADFRVATAAERTDPRITRCWLSSTAGKMPLLPWIPVMNIDAWFTAPTSPAWDNNYVNVQTVSGTFSRRLPIGSSR